MEQSIERLTEELSNLVGVVGEYWDIFGKKYVASLESKSLILKAMGFDMISPSSISLEIKRFKTKPWTRYIEPIYVTNKQPFFVYVYIELEPGKEDIVKITWRLKSKKGIRLKYETLRLNIIDERLIDNKRYVKIALPCTCPKDIDRFEIGYYDLEVNTKVQDREITGKSIVAICPEGCYYPFTEKDKYWGLSINLYSISSRDNWGIGDLGDLKYCINEVKTGGGSFVGINPLHAITNQSPYGISPYSPISKFYRNFIYINLKDVEGFKTLSDKSKKKIEAIKEAQYIDYEGIAEVKLSALKKIFDWFYKEHYQQKTSLDLEFEKYIEDEGELLQNFALYCAIANHEGRLQGLNKPLYSWRNWDAIYHDPKSEHVEKFKKQHNKDVLFYYYIQWLIDRQLKDIFECSKPMPLGIYNDLAVGSIRDGSDEWIYQDVFASHVNVGAPPDDCNPNGQDWGFPPLCPIRLKEHSYEPLIMSLRKNMKHCGALRIDHALGLFRMFWIPCGKKAVEGVYVDYPYEDILNIIALESNLHKTVIIAEDLGTVTDMAREFLNKYKMLSYKLLYFQREYPNHDFLLPEKYPEASLCTITTHDLPTIRGFWHGIDIDLKRSLSLIKDDDEYNSLLNERNRDKELLIRLLRQLGITDTNFEDKMDYKLIVAIYEFLARTRSVILSINLDDLMETMNQQNMPGTVNEYPCWIQKTPMDIENFFSSKNYAYLVDKLKNNGRDFKNH